MANLFLNCHQIWYPPYIYVSSCDVTLTTHWTFQVHNDDEVKALFKQVQGEVPGSPIFIMKVASQVRDFTIFV